MQMMEMVNIKNHSLCETSKNICYNTIALFYSDSMFANVNETNDDLQSEELILASGVLRFEESSGSGTGYDHWSVSGDDIGGVSDEDAVTGNEDVGNSTTFNGEINSGKFGHIAMESVLVGSIIICSIAAAIVLITSLVVLILSKWFRSGKQKQLSEADFWKWSWTPRCSQTPPRLKRNYERQGIDKSKYF